MFVAINRLGYGSLPYQYLCIDCISEIECKLKNLQVQLKKVQVDIFLVTFILRHIAISLVCHFPTGKLNMRQGRQAQASFRFC